MKKSIRLTIKEELLNEISGGMAGIDSLHEIQKLAKHAERLYYKSPGTDEDDIKKINQIKTDFEEIVFEANMAINAIEKVVKGQ